jgi:small-conductance mechanosensitive channel
MCTTAAIGRSSPLLRCLVVVLVLMTGSAALAQTATPAPDAPPQVKALLQLLSDPAVQHWLDQQRAAEVKPAPAPEAAAPAATPAGFVDRRLATFKEHLIGLAAAVPALPAQFGQARDRLLDEFHQSRKFRPLVLILAFIAIGFGVEWLFWRATAGARRRIAEQRLDTIPRRLIGVATRFAFGVGLLISFALGSIGAFLVFDWPPLLHIIVLGYLLAFLGLRIALVIGRFLLAPRVGRGFPDPERFRIVPMSNEAARFWYRRIGWLAAWFCFGYVTVQRLDTLGFEPDARRLVAYVLGIGLLAMGFEIAWRRPKRAAVLDPEAGEARPRRAGSPWLVAGWFAALWLFWVLGMIPAFWLLLVAVSLPIIFGVVQHAINHLLRPPGSAEAAEAPGLLAVSLERGARAALIIGAALLLARAWHIDLIGLASQDSVATRLLRGALNVVVIVLAADFIWHVIRALINRRLLEAQQAIAPDTDEGRRRGRMRTLLPILSNLMFVVVLAVTLLMALSAMGIEIGPLIAGAGVLGVAIGFGAQTLVRDIISGMFFLLDDAFRVGEYIQSGNFKGTVESFSLRSIKLRHHRGPLYTVPFGSLGAIQNMSRDWVIEKLQIGVTYDSDLEKARKLIKQVGKELAEDPLLAPHILETLKMQGVEQFGDFAIQIRLKMMTKPGEQFVVRRKALSMIKKAFDANGIQFAFPTVQVAGGTDAVGAAARQSLDMMKPVPEA